MEGWVCGGKSPPFALSPQLELDRKGAPGPFEDCDFAFQ